MSSNPDPVVVAVALALYGYNVSPLQRARKLYEHFGGNCDELSNLMAVLMSPRLAYAVTELDLPTAEAYVAHALERYGEEAAVRVEVNRRAYQEVSRG